MQIFTETVDGLFVGQKAEEAKLRAEKMAEMFNYKIEYFRNEGKEAFDVIKTIKKTSF